MTKKHLLYYIILVEGYCVLAAELLAIRGLIPFVGSGTEIIAIIISAVLLPLAIGYHVGGRAYARAWKKYSSTRRGEVRRGASLPKLSDSSVNAPSPTLPLWGRGKIPSIRKILLKNVLSALGIFALGLSYLFMEFFFGMMTAVGITSRLAQTGIYGALFLVWPVFLLGQTLPLVSHYFSKQNLNEATGTMLFFSTTGSFLGSVFSTLVLMSFIGVHNTVIVTLCLLATLVLLLARKLFSVDVAIALMVLGIAIALNHNGTMQSFQVVGNNAYNLIRIEELKDGTGLEINRSGASKISDDRSHMFGYIRYINDTFIAPIAHADTPRDILAIGSGGFTVGIDDATNHYTFVDIDPDLKTIAEKEFLRAPLSPNKQFIATSARAFVKHDTKRYDLIIIDVYTNVVSIPLECTTHEFLADVKKLLKPNGAVVANVVASPTFADTFTVRYTNTFTSVFPQFRQQMLQPFNPWDDEKHTAYSNKQLINMLYIYFDREGVDDKGIYTEDKNTYSLDR
jgi:hypothetical protein